MMVNSTSTTIVHEHRVDGCGFSGSRSRAISGTGIRDYIVTREGEMVSSISRACCNQVRASDIDNDI